MPLACRLSGATALHIGDRSYQQDQVMLLRHARADGCLLAVLADGMGGRSGGRLAADQVMLTARQLFAAYAPATDDGAGLLQELAFQAHGIIRLMAIASEQEPHSTLAAFLLNPAGDCHWIHAGDSRLYHFRDGVLVSHSRDHSRVQALIDLGEIRPEDAMQHPQAHVLTHCLGMAGIPPRQVHHIPQIQPGDMLMACSDGIWPHFSSEELGQVLDRMPARAACETLVEQARLRARGGGDNLSLAIVKVGHAPAAATG